MTMVRIKYRSEYFLNIKVIGSIAGISFLATDTEAVADPAAELEWGRRQET